MMADDKSIDLQTAVNMASWAHNTNVNILGYDPMSLVTGKSVTFPGVTTGNIATESGFDSDNIKHIMDNHHKVTRAFREAEYTSKINKISEIPSKPFTRTTLEEGDFMFYQDLLKINWLGPVKVFTQCGENVWVWAQGDLKKVAKCKIMLYKNKYGDDIEPVVIELDDDEDIGAQTRSMTKDKKKDKKKNKEQEEPVEGVKTRSRSTSEENKK
jgi:hypothetical protein